MPRAASGVCARRLVSGSGNDDCGRRDAARSWPCGAAGTTRPARAGRDPRRPRRRARGGPRRAGPARVRGGLERRRQDRRRDGVRDDGPAGPCGGARATRSRARCRSRRSPTSPPRPAARAAIRAAPALDGARRVRRAPRRAAERAVRARGRRRALGGRGDARRAADPRPPHHALPLLAIVTHRDGRARERAAAGRARRPGRAPGVARRAVEPLSQAAVGDLAAGHEVDPDELYARTAGNPFYVQEVLAAGGATVPPTVRDAVLARRSRLAAGAQGLLDAVACSPQPAEGWLLDAVCGAWRDPLGEGSRPASWPTAAARSRSGTRSPARRSPARCRRPGAPGPPRDPRRADRRTGAGRPGSARPSRRACARRRRDRPLRHGGSAPRRGGRRLPAGRGAVRPGADQLGEADPAERAALLEARAEAHYAADEQLASIDDLEAAIALHRSAGDVGREADATAVLTPRLLCRGRTDEARRRSHGRSSSSAAAPP